MMKEISPSELKINPFEIFSGDWMLLTAGNKETGCNTMTISWGQLGALWGNPSDGSSKWGKPISTVFVRPQRYTKEFMDREDYYTIAVYGSDKKKALAYLGAKSGKDEDKISKIGMKPVYVDNTSYISGAELVLICKKVYQAPILESGFLDNSFPEQYYPKKDYHEMYIGVVEKVLINENKISKYTNL